MIFLRTLLTVHQWCSITNFMIRSLQTKVFASFEALEANITEVVGNDSSSESFSGWKIFSEKLFRERLLVTFWIFRTFWRSSTWFNLVQENVYSLPESNFDEFLLVTLYRERGSFKFPNILRAFEISWRSKEAAASHESSNVWMVTILKAGQNLDSRILRCPAESGKQWEKKCSTRHVYR